MFQVARQIKGACYTQKTCILHKHKGKCKWDDSNLHDFFQKKLLGSGPTMSIMLFNKN